MDKYDPDQPLRPWEEALVAELGKEAIRDRIGYHSEEAAAAGQPTVALACYEPLDDVRCHVETLLSIWRGNWED